jgi:hypothetical protein
MNVPAPLGVDPKLFEVALQFMRFTHELWGAYLDALGGLRCVRERVIEFQNTKIAELKESDPTQGSEEFMDTQSLSHEFEPTNEEPQRLLHRSTQGDFKQRTAVDGPDARLLGYMMVALLYGAWEDVYRLKLAVALGHSEKKALQSDLFGDFAQLRHAIVHHAGIATIDVERAKILKWFRHGEMMFITSAQVDALYHSIDSYVTELCGIPQELIPQV